MNIYDIEVRLRVSVAKLKEAAEEQGVVGFITENDKACVYWKQGVELAAHVRELADSVGRIVGCESVVGRVERLLDAMCATHIFTADQLEDARLRWRAGRFASRNRPTFQAVA